MLSTMQNPQSLPFCGLLTHPQRALDTEVQNWQFWLVLVLDLLEIRSVEMGNVVLQKKCINNSWFEKLAVAYVAFRTARHLNRSRRISKQPVVWAKVWPVSVMAQKLMRTLFLFRICNFFPHTTILLLHTYIISTSKIIRWVLKPVLLLLAIKTDMK